MSKKTDDLLVEIGTEELPPKALKKLALAFSEAICSQLDNADLAYESTQWFATPRRLALLVRQLQAKQQDKTISRKGPAVAAAYDKSDQPSKAALGFAKSCGVEFDQLQTTKTDKGEWLSYDIKQPGQSIQTLIVEMVERALDQLPIPKRMRWGNSDVSFVRPMHWLVVMYGNKKIPATVYGIKSGNKTRGHRFHAPDDITLDSANDYEKTLWSAGMVVADFEERREKIVKQVEEIAKKAKGKAVIDQDLLDEVTSMVEWPSAIMGEFDASFLDVPAVALISAMKTHQKYFHLVDDQNKLLPNFITVSNIDSKDRDQVKTGNERVIRPRLSDAQFFWQQDQKRSLDTFVESLKTVTFQNKLGSLYDKTLRIQSLCLHIGKQLNVKSQHSERAALLAKADLMTDMVGEFPELQGIMGYHYAKVANEPNDIAVALDQYYRPRFSGDELPESTLAQALALADKLDTLVGIFGIGQLPTGDKDPYGLRRQALGCVRILIEKDLALDLNDLIDSAIKQYRDKGIALNDETHKQLYQFILSRIEVHYSNQGFSADLIESVICLKPAYLNDLDKRIKALADFQTMAEAESLAAANKRISNILKKSKAQIPGSVNKAHLKEQAEKNLASSLDQLLNSLDPLIEQANYQEAMKTLSQLKSPVDAFFDQVMVMDEDAKLRDNRLALLKSLRDQFLKIADISRLQH